MITAPEEALKKEQCSFSLTTTKSSIGVKEKVLRTFVNDWIIAENSYVGFDLPLFK